MIGAIINFLLFFGHLICLFCLDRMFVIYGISDFMDSLSSSYGDSVPYILTVVIALCFLACGLYALSACGIIRVFPLLKLGLFTITAVFLLRAFWGASMLLADFTWLEVSSTSVAALVGLLYLFGGIEFSRAKRAGYDKVNE